MSAAAPGQAQQAPVDRGMALMSARVTAAGALIDGAGAVSARSVGPGRYLVEFGRNIEGCTVIPTSQNNTGMTFTSLSTGSTADVVILYVPSGEYYSAAFQMIVYCYK
ncbi:hypothetical protein [Methylopila turkensis]|uniref:Uncharacterized protein n=1 Tax=Methylopila turkensis TaxID=1437816 RepID=A0A9W6JL25_9HYPH|nr:hypothetical protein [Methylopila turkensis]GLK79636.1 hypothetical protein GCM10008174_13770 [Methylopila turkensis]